MQDIKIGYSGGSGGFLLLHLLLLSGKFHTAFDVNDSLQNIINSQWNIKNHRDWKKSETWPNNLRTLSTDTQTRRLYFFCNPFNDSLFSHCQANSLILYTDFHSQVELAFYKKARWFCDNSDNSGNSLTTAIYKDLIHRWNNHYTKIKDPSWPSRVSPRRIDQLSMPISQEILKSSFTQRHLSCLSDFLLREILPFPSDVYNENLVDQGILLYLNSADAVIKLQDLINSRGGVLLDILDIPPMNKQQLDLIDHWKKLHPPELLEKIGIKI